MGLKKENWTWMPHAAHFISYFNCQFRLATYVGGYIVSTLGEFKENPSGKNLPLGASRTYETMVFKAKKSNNDCCPYVPRELKHVDFEGYNDAGAAYKGHMKLCSKWSKK